MGSVDLLAYVTTCNIVLDLIYLISEQFSSRFWLLAALFWGIGRQADDWIRVGTVTGG